MTMAAAIENRTAETPLSTPISRIASVEILGDLGQAETIWRGLESAQRRTDRRVNELDLADPVAQLVLDLDEGVVELRRKSILVLDQRSLRDRRQAPVRVDPGRDRGGLARHLALGHRSRRTLGHRCISFGGYFKVGYFKVGYFKAIDL